MLQTIHLLIFYILFSAINCSKLPEDCGTRSVSYKPLSNWRIVGGQRCDISEWPWQVAVLRQQIKAGSTIILSTCGGSIVNENWVLTAAHCLYSDPDVNSYYVYLGYSDLNNKTENAFISSVELMVKHEEFDFEKKTNDIALIKLSETIDFGHKHQYLRPVCLPNIESEPTDQCFATGYGYRDTMGKIRDKTLMKVSEPVYDISKCTLILDDINIESNICAGGSTSGGTGTCNGDSGGPLQCPSSDGLWYQIGVTSWGEPCAHEGIPDVFTRVAYFRDWIEKTIENN